MCHTKAHFNVLLYAYTRRGVYTAQFNAFDSRHRQQTTERRNGCGQMGEAGDIYGEWANGQEFPCAMQCGWCIVCSAQNFLYNSFVRFVVVVVVCVFFSFIMYYVWIYTCRVHTLTHIHTLAHIQSIIRHGAKESGANTIFVQGKKIPVFLLTDFSYCFRLSIDSRSLSFSFSLSLRPVCE